MHFQHIITITLNILQISSNLFEINYTCITGMWLWNNNNLLFKIHTKSCIPSFRCVTNLRFIRCLVYIVLYNTFWHDIEWHHLPLLTLSLKSHWEENSLCFVLFTVTLNLFKVVFSPNILSWSHTLFTFLAWKKNPTGFIEQPSTSTSKSVFPTQYTEMNYCTSLIFFMSTIFHKQ